jgi:hypothetical protein
MGAMCRHMGDQWHHIGGRWCYMGAACTIWGPYGSGVSMRELCAPYGSWVTPGAVWEVDGTIWEPNAPCGGHMGASCAVQEVDGLWEPCVAIWETDGTIVGTVWGPYGSGVSMLEPCALYGSRVHCMGAMHAVWEP